LAGEANITDVAALEEFRRALIRFREEIGVAIAEADSEIKSTFIWLERDRVLHWRRAVPRFEEELTSAKTALFRKEMQTMGTGQRPSTIDEKKGRADEAEGRGCAGPPRGHAPLARDARARCLPLQGRHVSRVLPL